MEVQRTHVIFVFRPIYGRQLGIEILHKINGVGTMCNRMYDCKRKDHKIVRIETAVSTHRMWKPKSSRDIDGFPSAFPSNTPAVERISCSILCGRLYWKSCTPEESSEWLWRLWRALLHVLRKTLAVKSGGEEEILRTKTLKISCWRILCVFSQKSTARTYPKQFPQVIVAFISVQDVIRFAAGKKTDNQPHHLCVGERKFQEVVPRRHKLNAESLTGST